MFISTQVFVQKHLSGFMQGKDSMRILMVTPHVAEASLIPEGMPKGLTIDVVSPSLIWAQKKWAEYDLAVVYLALTGFKKFLTVALHVKRADRAPSVVVLTCDCTLADKEDQLRRHVADGAINQALSTTRCGGTYDLFAIADAASRIWLARSPGTQTETEVTE